MTEDMFAEPGLETIEAQLENEVLQDPNAQATRQSLLNELEQLKSILDQDEVVAAEEADSEIDVPVLKETADDIPVLDSVVNDVEQVEVASFSRNPFLPDSIKEKLITGTMPSQIIETGVTNVSANVTAKEELAEKLDDEGERSLEENRTKVDSKLEASATLLAGESKDSLFSEDLKQSLVNELVDELLPQIELQLRSRLTKMVDSRLQDNIKKAD